MSLSIDIDYKLLAENFELEAYDNLFTYDFMKAIRSRRQEIIQNKKIDLAAKNRNLKLKTDYETKSCRIYAQRMHIQQHCIENQDEILEGIQTIYVDKINFTDKLNTNLDENEKVHKIFDNWLNGYNHLEPSDFFNEHVTNDP